MRSDMLRNISRVLNFIKSGMLFLIDLNNFQIRYIHRSSVDLKID